MLSNVTTTSYTVSGLSCGSSYNLAVSAYDPSGNYSTPTTIAAATAACPVPTGVSIAPSDGLIVSGTSVTVSASTTGSAAIQNV